MRRLALAALALAGCTRLLGIENIPYAGDAGPAGATDAAMIDAMPRVPKLQLGSPSYDFGGVTIGKLSFALSIEVSNVGAGATGPLGVTRGGDGADFMVSDDGCTSMSLAVGATCTFKVTFSPGAAGARASTFVVSDPSVSAETIFKGVGLTAGVVDISPSPFDFGIQAVGSTTLTRPLTVKNTGNTSVLVMSIAITNSATFVLNTGSCGPLPRTLPPNATCQVAVAFSPHLGGTQTSSLTVTIDAPSDNTASTSLGGTGSAMITVARSGDGTGTVTSGDLAISCPGTCTGTFTTSSVTLTAAAASGSRFERWTNCSSANGTTCTVTTDAPSATVDAAFAHGFVLTIELTGSEGAVMGPGINCRTGTDTCSAVVPAGTSVALTPMDVGASHFNLWTSGACLAQTVNNTISFPTCTFTMNADVTIRADFSNDFTINFVPDPDSVMGSNAHIDLNTADRNGASRCQTTAPFCTFHYAREPDVKAAAVSDDCATFHHYTGGGCGIAKTCEIMPGSAPITTVNYFYVMSPGNLCARAH